MKTPNTYYFDPDRVKAIRFRMGLTQKDFADRLGVSLSSITAWEMGRYLPKRGPQLKALLDAEMALEEAVGVA